MRIRSYWMAALAVTLFAPEVHAAGNALKGGSTAFGINNSGRIDLLSDPISYMNRSVAQGRRSISLRLGQPVLCADFANPPNGAQNPVGLVVTDPNSEVSNPIYGGITSYDYVTNGVSNSQFKVSAGSQLACCVMLPATNASCIQGTNGGAIVELLHLSGFESVSAGMQAGSAKGTIADLQVIVSGQPFVAPGGNFAYSIMVTNVGSTAVSNVRLRDWFPKSSGGFAAALSQGSWSCSASGGGSCGVGSGGGNLHIDNISLNPGANVLYNINRTMAAGVNNGATFSVSAAAFTPPADNEISLGNNQGVLTAVIQNSAPPTISDILNQPQTGLFPEDLPTTAIAFTASDSDSVLTTASLSCQSQNGALLDSGDCFFSGTEPNFTVVLVPNPNANGTSAMTITVSDGFSQVSDGFQLTISPRNDAPSFTLDGNITRPFGTVGIQQVNNFVSAISVGPADEAGQSFVARTATVQSGSSPIFTVSGDPNINYSGSPPTESGNLAFVLNGTPGTATILVRMQDSGGRGLSGDDDFEVPFTITVTGID